MTSGLTPYSAYKNSGVEWLREVLLLRNVAEMRIGNVDTYTNDDEEPVQLCNYALIVITGQARHRRFMYRDYVNLFHEDTARPLHD